MAHCRTSGVSTLLPECALGLEVIDQSDEVPVAVFAEEFPPDINLAFLYLSCEGRTASEPRVSFASFKSCPRPRTEPKCC